MSGTEISLIPDQSDQTTAIPAEQLLPHGMLQDNVDVNESGGRWWKKCQQILNMAVVTSYVSYNYFRLKIVVPAHRLLHHSVGRSTFCISVGFMHDL